MPNNPSARRFGSFAYWMLRIIIGTLLLIATVAPTIPPWVLVVEYILFLIFSFIDG